MGSSGQAILRTCYVPLTWPSPPLPTPLTGDVKYHLGQSGTLVSRGPGGEALHTRLSIAPNPSHLEAVDPVVLGMVRAEQERTGAGGRRRVLGLLLHGDAAVAGGDCVSPRSDLCAVLHCVYLCCVGLELVLATGWAANKHGSQAKGMHVTCS
jgi:hypothetical protein